MTKPLLAASLIIIVAVITPSYTEAARNPAPKQLHKAALRKNPPPPRTQAKTAWVVCQVFKTDCRRALNIAYCESRLNRYARNGQYRGIFQMGSRERATHGHGKSIWAQTRAAKRLYNQRGWQPWTCKG